MIGASLGCTSLPSIRLVAASGLGEIAGGDYTFRKERETEPNRSNRTEPNRLILEPAGTGRGGTYTSHLTCALRCTLNTSSSEGPALQ